MEKNVRSAQMLGLSPFGVGRCSVSNRMRRQRSNDYEEGKQQTSTPPTPAKQKGDTISKNTLLVCTT